MTAVAKLPGIIGSMLNFADVADRCELTEGNAPAAIRAWANQLAALSPAELDGTELPVGEVSDGFSGHQRAVNLYGPIRCQPAPGTNLYTTPRAAEAPTVSLADIGLCKWAAHILSDPERFNARANDASAAIGRLVASLTPPSAKGE